MKNLGCLIIVCLMSGADARGEAEPALRFADVLTDHMVLQRDQDVACWGWARPGSEVELLLTQSRDDVVEFAGARVLSRTEQKAASRSSGQPGVRVSYVEDEPAVLDPVRMTVQADETGKWFVTLGKHAASFTPTFLAARSGEVGLVLQNLLIGEVWIASGQSNMAWSRTHDKMWENQGLIFNGIRYARVFGDAYIPRDRFSGKSKGFSWIECEDGNVDNVSTLPYLFAQYLHRRLKVPVGIINLAEGGSFAREWCARALLKTMDSPTVDRDLREHGEKVKVNPDAMGQRGPASLYNARLFPIRHLNVAGVIYLQGENEALAGGLPQYEKTFPGVIDSFRAALERPNLPFGIITLQGMGNSDGYSFSSYSAAREIHQSVHKTTSHTGYIVAHDIGGGIHPNWKRPLAERAVYWALRDVYGEIQAAKRTRIASVHIKDSEALVTFEEVELDHGKWVKPRTVIPEANNQAPVGGFMIAGADQHWFPGRVAGTVGKPEGLVVSHPMVKHPVALRYGWEGWSRGNLGSWHDPIPPYRTDDWPVVGKDEIYDAATGQPSSAERNYHRMHDARNRRLELPLQLGAEEANVQLTKRYAHPKPVLQSMLKTMETLLDHFDVEKYNEMVPELREHALHNIPARYWRRDRYSPARQAKWGWLIERVIRLETFTEDMDQALKNPAVEARLEDLRKAIDEVKAALENLPDPEAMAFDDMLDTILPVMEKEKETLLEQGVDLRKLEKEMARRPF